MSNAAYNFNHMKPDYGKFEKLKSEGRTVLSSDEVAEVLNISAASLTMRRSRRLEPHWIKRSDGGIAYTMEALEAFLMGTPCGTSLETRVRKLGMLPAKSRSRKVATGVSTNGR